MRTLLADDLDRVLAQTAGLWDDLRGARILLTGGTGFFGCWLLETVLWANARLGAGVSAVVLTRDPGAFSARVPHLASDPAVAVQEGDIRTCTWRGGALTHVIHAGTDTRVPVTRDDRLRVFDTIVEGTRRTLEMAERAGAGRVLMTSTGAVYGRQPADITHVPEEFRGAPDPVSAASAGAEAKRAAEMLCALYAEGPLHPTIARCFAFVGPYLPLDAHFAVGNFIRDALQGGPIRIKGDGTPYRSYLYAADLAIWLWTIVLRGEPMRAYNVGSEEAITIAGLADLVGGLVDVKTELGRQPIPGAPERYVPSTRRAAGELGLRATIPVETAIQRTMDWHRKAVLSR